MVPHDTVQTLYISHNLNPVARLSTPKVYSTGFTEGYASCYTISLFIPLSENLNRLPKKRESP